MAFPCEGDPLALTALRIICFGTVNGPARLHSSSSAEQSYRLAWLRATEFRAIDSAKFITC